MLEILVIQKPLHNHVEFKWKLKFLMKSMKVRVGMVEVPLMWWPLDRFKHLHHVEFDVEFT